LPVLSASKILRFFTNILSFQIVVAKTGKVEVKKKKGKGKKENNDGQFWWNNTVYASW
jgi:hypothetical protein